MLTLWKLHSKACKEANKKEFSKLPKDQHRLFKKCQCACHVTGVHPLTNLYVRQSLNVTSWEAGEKLKEQLENGTDKEVAARAVTLEGALDKWIADKQRIGVAAHTIDGYRAFAKAVLAFATEEGLVLLHQFDDLACMELIESDHWTAWSRSSQNRHLASLSGFFKFAMGRWKLQSINPTLNIVRAPAADGNVESYTTEEAFRLEEAFGNWTQKLPDLQRKSQWNYKPETLHCLKHVIEDTGLRISDAQRVRPAIIHVLPNGDGECTINQIKKGGAWGKDDMVTVYLRRETLEEMARVPWISTKYPFLRESPHENNPDLWRRHLTVEYKRIWQTMQLVGRVAGVEDCRPHRFRHTFACRMLEKGWTLEQVSHFLGHKSISTTERYYAKWDESRKLALRNEVVLRRNAEASTLQFPAPQPTAAGDNERKVG
jgi:site-specific recombinase XerD